MFTSFPVKRERMLYHGSQELLRSWTDLPIRFSAMEQNWMLITLDSKILFTGPEERNLQT
ncbi:hypothetical protein lerEdw1_014541 [Lerista edwardsae]|nr:hypothetical protein lerEdw1_014542 [Lerista edwardsae]KAJ6633191.1 hypothetical protein lerEdw1_014541 [Lerista edwardsae]